MSTRKFTARIEDAGRGGAFVSIPFDVEEAFGKKRVPIKATIDGEPYRGTLSYTHKKEFVKWILEAKRPETRTSRVKKTIEMVRQGQSR
jgi:uncharacterized protein YdeI (YjbR/CyaY-like superfamily)